MKAYKVYPYDGNANAEQREKAWQAFYNAAGLLGIEVTSGYRDAMEATFSRMLVGGPGSTVTIHLEPGRLVNPQGFPTYDPDVNHGGTGLR